MVKALIFKGDKKPKKRKRTDDSSGPSKSSRTAEAPPDDESAPEIVHNPGDEDVWVNVDKTEEITGPLMVVLPGGKPSALACDATGKVFAIEVENIVDGNKSSAEPHDVRQVWVVNRVTGTEGFRFKGAYGKYLSCSPSGALTAESEAISSHETFYIIPAGQPSVFHIRTSSGRYFTTTSIKGEFGNFKLVIRGDVETSNSDDTTIWLRMQSRFKPKVKTEKEERLKDRISKRDLEKAVGRRLEDDEVKLMKRARQEGDYYEQLLRLRAKGKHDKYSY